MDVDVAQPPTSLDEQITGLESSFWPPRESYRGFWARVREINEALKEAPDEERAGMQQRLNALCRLVRNDQKRHQEEQKALQESIADALRLATESLAESETTAEVQAVRADLVLVRRRIEEAGVEATRALWPIWQDVNQQAWARLSEMWRTNEDILSRILDEATAQAEKGDARGTKEIIRRFHSEIALRECSRQNVPALRRRAAELWQHADAIGRERRERYLIAQQRRVDTWQRVLADHARLRGAIENQIVELQRQAAAAATDVGAALLRGRVEERKRALADLETRDRDLEQRIETATSQAAN